MFNPLECTGRTILVTGASSGIGREISVVLSQLGARVVMVGRDVGRLQHTASLLMGEGHVVEPRDLSDVESIPAWMKELTSRTGLLNGLVHSAGIQKNIPLKIAGVAQFESIMKVNVIAAFSLTKGFRQKGVCTQPASVIFISSIMGQVSTPGLAAYSASKGALNGLCRSLALELAREKIRVNCVAPGLVRTEMADQIFQNMTPEQIAYQEMIHPLGLGEPRDVAYATAFLLAETGRWITGSTLVVDGGYIAQ
jgi:NAD(P)-dependent dehydrogenase (short-subunit alcohol dehydrogenase family)